MDSRGVHVEVGMTITSGPPLDRPVGVHAGFVALYERELGPQVRRATLLVGSSEDAHDLVHDAFVEVYRRWEQLRDPGPYLGTAVLNRCRDHGRRKLVRARHVPPPPEGVVHEDEVLWDALMKLPFNHRAALVLRFYQQLPEREIARLLGCRPGSVGPWIQRGLRTLRKDLS